MAGITELKCDLLAAHRRGDLEFASKIVAAFCSRMEEYSSKLPEGWLDSDCAEEIRLHHDGFYIKFAGLYLHCRKHQERWCVSESKHRGPSTFDSYLQFVSYTAAPFSFFEGIRFALECMENVQHEENDRIFVSLEQKRLEAKREYEFELAKWENIRGDYGWMKEKIARMQQELLAARYVTASQNAVSLPVAGLQAMMDELPKPPSETVSVPCVVQNLAGVSGVYFIWRDGEIVYVGRADCLSKRFKNHHIAEPPDHVSVIAMPENETHLAELVYIAAYKPRLNKEVRAWLMEKRPRKKKAIA
jgi:hypothetical protein